MLPVSLDPSEEAPFGVLRTSTCYIGLISIPLSQALIAKAKRHLKLLAELSFLPKKKTVWQEPGGPTRTFYGLQKQPEKMFLAYF